MDLLKDLQWRYATKAYTDKKVSDEKLDFILEAINLTASSCGLQPYRVFAIENKEIRAKLGEGSFNKQITQASHLLVFAAYNNVTTEHIEKLIKLVAKNRGVAEADLKDLFTKLDGYFNSRSIESNRHWSDKQAYIALGTALIAAANVKVDATPMEGFDPAVFDELLGLKDKGLHTTVILSLGFRDETADFLAAAPKVRIPVQEMVTMI